MRKFLTVVTTIVASLIFVMTAFAADTWKLESDAWKCYDKDGVEYTCTWKRSGDNFYYLGADGKMVVSSLVDNDDSTYSYVDETGAKVFNKWELITDAERDIEDAWMYFKANGKSVYNGWYTISSQKYYFADNKMVTGYIGDSGAVDTYADAVSYCGDDGVRVSGWLSVIDDNGDKIWLYFKNGIKVKDTIITISNKKYMFDADGKMLTGINIATASGAEVQYNFNSDGSMVKKAWIQKTDDNGDNYWVYANNDGSLVEDGVKKINGKYYAFVDTKMVTGFYFADGTIKNADNVYSTEFAESGVPSYYYFCELADSTEGSAMTGRKDIELADGKFTFMFNNDGTANMNRNIKGYFYTNGMLRKHDKDADGYTYGVVAIPGQAGSYVLVNNSGKIQTKDVNDTDATKWVFHDGKVSHYRKNDNTKAYDILIAEYEVGTVD